MVRKWDEAVEPPAGDARNDILSVDFLREWHRSLPQPTPRRRRAGAAADSEPRTPRGSWPARSRAWRARLNLRVLVAECLDQLRRSILVPDSIASRVVAESRLAVEPAYPAARITSAASLPPNASEVETAQRTLTHGPRWRRRPPGTRCQCRHD